MSTASEITQIRGQLGAAVRHGPPELADELRQDLVALNIQAAIERTMGEATALLSPDRAARLHQVIARYTNDARVPDLATA